MPTTHVSNRVTLMTTTPVRVMHPHRRTGDPTLKSVTPAQAADLACYDPELWEHIISGRVKVCAVHSWGSDEKRDEA